MVSKLLLPDPDWKTFPFNVPLNKKRQLQIVASIGRLLLSKLLFKKPSIERCAYIAFQIWASRLVLLKFLQSISKLLLPEEW